MPHRPPPSPAVLHHRRPSPTVPYQNISPIVGLVVLPNDGRPGNSRTRTDGICRPVSSRGLGSPPAGPYGGPGRLRTLNEPTSCAVIHEAGLSHALLETVTGTSGLAEEGAKRKKDEEDRGVVVDNTSSCGRGR